MTEATLDAPSWPSAGAATHAVRRALHVLRRRIAFYRLRRRPPASILVVCHGNICRSPFAERVLQDALPDVHVSSAGFLGPNRRVPEAALVAAALRGVNLAAHRSRQLNGRMVRDADLIMVMDVAQRSAVCRRWERLTDDVLLLGDCDPSDQPVARAIADPVSQPLDSFFRCYARIESCVTAAAGALSDASRRGAR